MERYLWVPTLPRSPRQCSTLAYPWSRRSLWSVWSLLYLEVTSSFLAFLIEASLFPKMYMILSSCSLLTFCFRFTQKAWEIWTSMLVLVNPWKVLFKSRWGNSPLEHLWNLFRGSRELAFTVIYGKSCIDLLKPLTACYAPLTPHRQRLFIVSLLKL